MATAMTVTDEGVTDDRDLAHRISGGSESALSEAYSRHADAVYGLARRLTRNASLAEEVTQEVFLRLWRQPEKFDPARGSLRTFLLAHAHGRSVDLIRSESARRRREDNEGVRAPAAVPTVEEEVMSLNLAQEIRDALDALSAAERTAVTLAYFRGLTYREVASELGVPEGTIKSRIRSGLSKLRVAVPAWVGAGA